jgi:DNA-directed RNA polymerase subunit RPC12/RpoP
MQSTWKILHLVDGPNCRCLICGKQFTFLGDDHFNMRLITCLTCNQQVWIPKCLNGCPSFYNEDKECEL